MYWVQSFYHQQPFVLEKIHWSPQIYCMQEDYVSCFIFSFQSGDSVPGRITENSDGILFHPLS